METLARVLDPNQLPPDNLDEVVARYAEAAPRYGIEFVVGSSPLAATAPGAGGRRRARVMREPKSAAGAQRSFSLPRRPTGADRPGTTGSLRYPAG
jgi:hypothetical protein